MKSAHPDPLGTVIAILIVFGLLAAISQLVLGFRERSSLHERRICVPPNPCTTVGVPAGECATVHGVTVCVGPDAGMPSSEVSP